jgi:hypothetical protein
MEAFVNGFLCLKMFVFLKARPYSFFKNSFKKMCVCLRMVKLETFRLKYSIYHKASDHDFQSTKKKVTVHMKDHTLFPIPDFISTFLEF